MTTDDETLRLRADLELESGNFDDAVRDYTGALAKDPLDPASILKMRARAFEKLGKHDLAQKDLNRAKRSAETQ